MKVLGTLVVFALAGSVYAQSTQMNQQQPQAQQGGVEVMEEQEMRSDGQDVYKRDTSEVIGDRQEMQVQEGNVEGQLQQAKENVKTDEKNIQKAEEKRKENESQVDIDKASIEKYEAQLQEDKATVKKLEEKVKSKNPKKENKGMFD